MLAARPPCVMLFVKAPAVVEAGATFAPVTMSFWPPYFVVSVVTPG